MIKFPKFNIPTFKQATDYIAERINAIFFKKDERNGDTEKLFKKTADLGATLCPMAKVDKVIGTTNEIIRDFSENRETSPDEFHPYHQYENIGKKLGESSNKLATDLETTLKSENLPQFLSNSADIIDDTQGMISTIASSAQNLIAEVNGTYISNEIIDSFGTENKGNLQKLQNAQKTYEKGLVNITTNIGLKPLSNALKVAASAIELAEKRPPEINSFDEIVKGSEEFSSQLAKDSSKILKENVGDVGGLVNYFQNLIDNSKTREDGYRRL